MNSYLVCTSCAKFKFNQCKIFFWKSFNNLYLCFSFLTAVFNRKFFSFNIIPDSSYWSFYKKFIFFNYTFTYCQIKFSDFGFLLKKSLSKSIFCNYNKTRCCLLYTSAECNGRRELDCETDGSSRCESRA